MLIFAGKLLLHFFVSMLRLITAAVVTVAFALPLGWAAHKQKAVRFAVQFFCAVPAMALLPMLMLLFGIGEGCKLILLTVSGVWACAMRLCGTFACLQEYLLPFYINGFSSLRIVLLIMLPFLRRDIAEAFRQTFLVSITLLLFAENYGTRYGVGYLINHAWQAFDYTGVAWGIILAAAMGLCCNIGIEKAGCRTKKR